MAALLRRPSNLAEAITEQGSSECRDRGGLLLQSYYGVRVERIGEVSVPDLEYTGGWAGYVVDSTNRTCVGACRVATTRD